MEKSTLEERNRRRSCDTKELQNLHKRVAKMEFKDKIINISEEMYNVDIKKVIVAR